jgi:BirA family biotin operon repressor/biotin-[acetyl-CoA-carboxylase] ligase
MSALGRPRVHLRRTDSTNERARALALAGAPHGTVVTASEQTAGRGRQGRSWLAPPGSSVLMSLLVRQPPQLLPLIAAVAVCDVAGEEAQIKWPNDVVIARDTGAGPLFGKLAGTLIEGRPQEGWAVVGIGLNVAVRLDELPPELRPGNGAGVGPNRAQPAATLGRTPADVEPALSQLLGALERRLGQDAETTLEAWRARDALRGREITWGAHGVEGSRMRGRADGIDGLGRLVVARDDGGLLTLGAGEVHLAPLE